MPHIWEWKTKSLNIGTRVWRCYMTGGYQGARSFTFGIWAGHDKEAALAYARTTWGADVTDVELVTP